MGLIKTAQPALHADQHLPWGSDPIPGLLVSNPGFADYVTSFPSLQAWYRLGTGDPPDFSQALDSSGHSLDLTGHLGALTPSRVDHTELGDDDDQATMFNSPQLVTTTPVGGPSAFYDPSYPPSGSDTGWTLTGFINPGDVVAAWLALVGGTLPSYSGYISIPFGCWNYAGTPSGGAAFYYKPYDQTITGVWRNGSSEITLGPTSGLPLNTWYHLALVWDNTADTVTLYLNGVEIDTDAAAFVASPHNLFIGMGDQPSGGSNYPCFFYGAVDEVALFNEALTASEIAGFVTAGSGPASPPSGPAGGVLDGSYPNPGFAATVAGAGLSEASHVLSVNVDASTIEIAADTLRVKADGVTANEIAANAVGTSELASTTVSAGTYGDSTHVGRFTVDADGRLTAASSVTVTGTFDPASATTWWFPLADSDGTLVLDDNGDLIPTLTPLP